MARIELTLHGETLDAHAVDHRHEALARARDRHAFELWASMEGGPSMSMLRNGRHAWLMYLREPGDSGFWSVGDATRSGVVAFRLSNGQVDEYPLAWCIDVERGLQAVEAFCAWAGAMPGGVDWAEVEVVDQP